MSDLPLRVGDRGKTWSVWAASLFQATLAGLGLIGAYALWFGWFAMIGLPFALVAGPLSGVAAAVVITRRRRRWSMVELRWAVAGSVFTISALMALLVFPWIYVTFPLPFIAAGIAAWRTKDLARPERRGGPVTSHTDRAGDGSL